MLILVLLIVITTTNPKNHGALAPTLLILAKISTHIHTIEPE
jgi:hypothetical protein